MSFRKNPGIHTAIACTNQNHFFNRQCFQQLCGKINLFVSISGMERIFINQKPIFLSELFGIRIHIFCISNPLKKENDRCALLAAILMSYFYIVNNRCLIRGFFKKGVIFFFEISAVIHRCCPPKFRFIKFFDYSIILWINLYIKISLFKP